MSGKLPVLVLVLVAFGAAATPLRAALSDDQRRVVLAEAQAAYDRGVDAVRRDPTAARVAFDEAATRFEQLIDDGVVNGALHYNLGNAHLQAGRLGPAILSYRRAEQLIPGDPRLRHNLEYARSLRTSRIAPSGDRALREALLTWHRRTSPRLRFWTFEAAFAGFWLVLTVNLFRPASGWRWGAVACLVVWGAAGASLAVDHFVGSPPAGVILGDEVVVRKGNGEGFEPQFEEPLSEGVEFRVLGERPGWLHIELPDRSEGWVSADQVGLIG
jgi:hypothetical protein